MHNTYVILLQARKDKKTDPLELSALEKANKALLEAKPARAAGLTTKEIESIRSLMLLTLKPVIYAANVADSDLAAGNEMSKIVFEYAEARGSKAVIVSAQVGTLNYASSSSLCYMQRDKVLFVLMQLCCPCEYCRWSRSCRA